MNVFQVLLITFIVSVEAKSTSQADNAAQPRSLKSEMYVESSVANDNICNNHEKNVAFDVILFEKKSHNESKIRKKRQAPYDNRIEYKNRPRSDQKSLVIVFDATGSMHDDLEQLRAGAKQIVTELSARDDNPIFNYILVVYRDPTVEPAFQTKNPDDLLAKLKQIQTIGGGDCAEYALTGLKVALQLALPNSLAYVFSDATAKDLAYYEEVLGLIQKKQATVNFLLTGDCDDPAGPGYQVYVKLSRASNGQVYDMNKSNVKDVLLAIRHTVNYNYAALTSVDADSAGTSNTKLNVDKSISELSVSLSGKNPRLTITDPMNETVKSGEELSLMNLKLVKIKDPVDGLWNVEAEAESSHSIRLGGISDLKFDFGFSTEVPEKKSETSFQPLASVQNILSIFVIDPSLVKTLSDVTIILFPSNSHEMSHKFKLTLKKVDDQIYVTKAFDIPRQMFKIQLNGFDVNGNPIERLISTGIQASQGSEPEVIIEANEMQLGEHQKLYMKCIVFSHTPVNISWVFNERILRQLKSNQSNELELVINKIDKVNAGSYSCEAINTYGGERKFINVTVSSAPRVTISPKEILDREGSFVTLQCHVSGDENGNYNITWRDFRGKVLQVSSEPNKDSFSLKATRDLNEKTISCEISTLNSILISDTAHMLTEYPPTFNDQQENQNLKLKVRLGEDFELNCETDENPEGEVRWFFVAKDSRESRELHSNENILKLTFKNEGEYQCSVTNSHGKAKRSFNVSLYPRSHPRILMDQDVIIVNETDSIDLVCETKNSLPIKNFSWFNENSNNYETFTIIDETSDNFKSVLRINDIDESDNGSFECHLINEAGEDKKTFELLVQTKPKIDVIMLKVNDTENEVSDTATILLGDDVTLDCIVDGFPLPRIKWILNNVHIKTDENETKLKLKVHERHQGIYQCSASNILGDSTENIRLVVNYPPKVEGSIQKVLKVLQGDLVSLDCNIAASPDPNLSWFFDGNFLMESNQKFRYKDQNNSINFVANLTNTGEFSCVGVNDYGKAEMKYSVVVLKEPTILDGDDVNKKMKIGEDLILTCDASGYPFPQISWIKYNNLIEYGTKLTINKVTSIDSGVYICEATNEVGKTQKIFYVTTLEEPRIVSMLSNLTLHRNTTQDVECRASGTPTPTIQWFHNKMTFGNESRLNFNARMESGWYHCKAENSEGTAESSMFLNVLNKPTLKMNYEMINKEVKVREGDELELNCPFDDFDSIIWMHNDDSINNLNYQQNDKILTIRNVDHTANGDWKCLVANQAGDDFFSFKVLVLTSPKLHTSWNLNSRSSEFLFTESDIDEKTFNLGDRMELNCSASGFPEPKIVWKKATDVIANGEVLVIENLQFHHSDIYTCRAENDQGTVTKFFKVEVVSPPFIDSFDVQRNFFKFPGDSLTMLCDIIGSPIPNIFWFKNNVLIEEEVENHLEFKKLILSNHGSYKCIGKNSLGMETIEYHVSMMDPAKIITAEEEQKVLRNENSMTISCTVSGNPLPVVSWINNGYIISTTSKVNFPKLFDTVHDSVIYFNGYGNAITYLDPFKLKKIKEKFYSKLTQMKENSLKLDVVFKERSLKTSGIYQCYAYNALGRDEKVVEIKINEKPYISEKQAEELQETEVLEGLPLLLTCLLAGEPTPRIFWYKENIQLHANETIKLLNENRFLSIAEAFSWDSGNYSCKGVNQVGEEKLNFKVSVLSPPKFVRYSVEPLLHTNDFKNSKLKHDRRERNTIVVKVMKDEDVTLECLTESSPKAKVHWLKIDFYDSSKNILLDEDEENLFIKSIKESSSFMCYINNTVGNVHKIFQIDVQYAPKLVGDERTEVKHSNKLHHGVNLLCNVEGNPEPQVQWMFNGTKILNSDKRFYFSNNNQIMRIIDINKSNQGKFLCNAVNDYGRLQRIFYVNVEVPIQWSAFGPWTTCSVSCGSGGIQYRTRICLLTNGLPATAEDYHCVGENVESRKCNQLACPINGGWGKFSEWSKCPKCIDDAIHELPVTSKRVRKCDSPQPSNGGLDCSGSDIEELECKIDFCPVHGGWSKWSPWSACSKTCGSGHRTRKRECNNPSPKYNGTSCRGENVEFEECKMKLCLAQNLKKSFRSDYEDDFEEKSNESREKYKELAELEIKDEKGNVRNFQFMNHREIEFSSPIRDLMGPNIPKIIVTLDTYKPISEETFLEHLSRLRVVHDEAQTESSSSNNLELDSTESVGKVRKKCIRGFAYNTNNDQCEDINECEEQHQNNCKHDEKCVNVLGSFRCDKKPQRRMKS